MQITREINRKPHIVATQATIGNSFIFVISIMTFLASLCIGIAFFVFNTLQDWDSRVSRDITIQLRPIDGVNLSANIQKVIELSLSENGIKSATLITHDQQKKLLTPWLGEDVDISVLTLPELVAIELKDTSKFSIENFSEKISAEVKGASIDDHRIWRDKLNYSASLIILTCFVIFSLVMLAAAFTITFATRGTLASSRHVVNVLNLLGAPHNFIAGEFQKEYFRFGLKGAAIGGCIAILVFLSFDILEYFKILPNLEYVLPVSRLSIGTLGFATLIGQMFFVSLLTALISRFTTLKLLENNTQF